MSEDWPVGRDGVAAFLHFPYPFLPDESQGSNRLKKSLNHLSLKNNPETNCRILKIFGKEFHL
jgi:hypothetical protein